MLDPRFDEALRELVQRWDAHAQAAAAGDFAAMLDTKTALDEARIQAAQVRRLVA